MISIEDIRGQVIGRQTVVGFCEGLTDEVKETDKLLNERGLLHLREDQSSTQRVPKERLSVRRV